MSRQRILVVDDEVLVRQILSETLADAGFETAEAGQQSGRSRRVVRKPFGLGEIVAAVRRLAPALQGPEMTD